MIVFFYRITNARQHAKIYYSTTVTGSVKRHVLRLHTWARATNRGPTVTNSSITNISILHWLHRDTKKQTDTCTYKQERALLISPIVSGNGPFHHKHLPLYICVHNILTFYISVHRMTPPTEPLTMGTSPCMEIFRFHLLGYRITNEQADMRTDR